MAEPRKDEKELTRRGDRLTEKRRQLPWVPVEREYRFETEQGTRTLAELFDGSSTAPRTVAPRTVLSRCGCGVTTSTEPAGTPRAAS
jgi:uncharacterized protein DUF899